MNCIDNNSKHLKAKLDDRLKDGVRAADASGARVEP
jgi:hypothetical protein